jgi:cysteinyl-tRNA synthetase
MIHLDQIRDKLKELNVTIEDSKDETKRRYP